MKLDPPTVLVTDRGQPYLVCRGGELHAATRQLDVIFKTTTPVTSIGFERKKLPLTSNYELREGGREN